MEADSFVDDLYSVIKPAVGTLDAQVKSLRLSQVRMLQCNAQDFTKPQNLWNYFIGSVKCVR